MLDLLGCQLAVVAWDVLLRLLLQVLELTLLDLCTTTKDAAWCSAAVTFMRPEHRRSAAQNAATLLTTQPWNACEPTAGVLRCLTFRPGVVQQSGKSTGRTWTIGCHEQNTS